jgi:hypothetical protein
MPKRKPSVTDPSVPLKNPRHEQFVQLVATGKSPKDSFILAGFSKVGAASCAARLLQVASVGARVEHLTNIVASAAVTRAAVDRDWVLSGLRSIAEDREQSGSARVQAYTKVGEALGVFRPQGDGGIGWDGDLTKLTWQQLLRLQASARQLEGGPCFDIVPEVQP